MSLLDSDYSTSINLTPLPIFCSSTTHPFSLCSLRLCLLLWSYGTLHVAHGFSSIFILIGGSYFFTSTPHPFNLCSLRLFLQLWSYCFLHVTQGRTFGSCSIASALSIRGWIGGCGCATCVADYDCPGFLLHKQTWVLRDFPHVTHALSGFSTRHRSC